MSGGGKGGGSQRVTQEVAIPDFLRPFVKQQSQIGVDALGRLENRLQGAGAAELVAPMNADQQAAIDRARALATDPTGSLALAENQLRQISQTGAAGGVGADQLLATARGDFLFGSPGSQAAIDAAVRSAMPSILSTFGSAGRGTGGLAQAAIAQQATDAFARQFDVERQRQLAAAGQLSQQQLAALGALPGVSGAGIDILSSIGGLLQQQQQRELTAPISAQEALLQAAGGGIPLGSLLGQVGTGSGGGGSSLAGGLSGGLGGALAGAQLGSIVPGIGTAFGAIGGGLIGGLGGLLS